MQRTSVRILLVEDNPGDARLIQILLAEASSSVDFEVVRAEHLAGALEQLDRSGFGATLLDLWLPDSGGLETVSRMRAAAPALPIVVLSGQDDEEAALEALHMGAQDYLIKGEANSDLIARTVRYAIERARTEKELRHSEERFRLLVQGVKDYAIFMLSQDGRVTSWNEAAGNIHGYRTDEIIGERLSVFYTEEEAGRFEEHLRVAAGEGRYEEEGLRVRKDGSTFWVDTVITATRDESGELRGFSCVTRDITGRKEAEEALRRSLKELADLKFALDESVMMAMADVEGRIIYVNDRFCGVAKLPREEFLTREHTIIDAGYHSEGFVERFWRTVRRGEVWHGEVRHLAGDGSHYWLDATVVPSLDERGEPYRYVAICHDVTTRKEAEETLRRSLKELANLKFASGDAETSGTKYRLTFADYQIESESRDPGETIA